ncbi:hypothetical protein K1T71_007191 [Dendrolimus kikuchii]|uniref:Uncharacterized protein n=1 Tax=Dendrolimus kikuchii TaxID=765133 RepID=A0ACC1CZZ8_9NEOP|nr:hypothetical protein K1T71_007191 [Dendrolimus kikuchii]
MVFLIIASILLFINIVFGAVAFVHSLSKKDVEEPRLSAAQMMMNRQHLGSRSSLPQVTIFNAVLRLSVGSNHTSTQNEDGENNCAKKIAADENDTTLVSS